MIYIDDSEPDEVLEPAFPYRDVTIKRGVDANNLYEILSEIGRGKFGTVYRCREKSSGLQLAAKFVPIPKREDRRNVEREVEVMNSLQHHLIIQLYAAYEYQKMMCVVQELVEGGELFDRVVDDEFVLTERVCVVFMRQLCEAMQFIHRNNILHLDLKPENILCLTQQGNRIKIIDFGLARKYDPNKKLQILFGTPEFVAPEVVNFDCISYGTDMWSVGVICYVLISGLSPFMGETDIETMANVTIAKYDFEDESFGSVSPECLDFIAKLLVKDLSTRMTAAQCLTHKWLQRRPRASTPPPPPPTVITTKPTNVPPTKPKAASPKPVTSPPHGSEDINKELETTKDNLKNFIERWEEHPNSPYVFDVEGNLIVPLSETSYLKPNGGDSITSSRVCSPSPCESIGTITDLEEENKREDLATPINESRETLFPCNANSSQSSAAANGGISMATGEIGSSGSDWSDVDADGDNLQRRSWKSYLHTFDRRNSDTNYLLGRRCSGERLNLADEIRKLSDHLLMLAEINTKFGSDDTTEPTTATAAGSSDENSNVAAKNSNVGSKAAAASNKLGSGSAGAHVSSAKPSKLNTAAASNTADSGTNNNKNHSNTKITTKTKTRRSTLEPTTPTLANGNSSRLPVMGKKVSGVASNGGARAANSARNAKCAAGQTLLESAASKRRAKFRINQMSRDVPIGLPDTHQSVNLEEAANTTKDCLLHLLEKYNATRSRNPLGRHQSISVDWNITDNLEYRSMNSINAFFQRHHNTGENVKQLQAHLERKGTGK